MLSTLLEGAAKLKKVKTLNLRKTEIGLQAAESLKLLFLAAAPWHFEELRIEDC